MKIYKGQMQKNRTMKYKSGVGHKPISAEMTTQMFQSKVFIIYILHAQQTVVICIVVFVNYIQNFIQHSAVTVTPSAEEIIVDHQCGFLRNRSTTDHILEVCHPCCVCVKTGRVCSQTQLCQLRCI